MRIIQKPRSLFSVTRLMLFNQDSNLDKQDQNLLCCHYTIEQYTIQTNSFVSEGKSIYFFYNHKYFIKKFQYDPMEELH